MKWTQVVDLYCPTLLRTCILLYADTSSKCRLLGFSMHCMNSICFWNEKIRFRNGSCWGFGISVCWKSSFPEQVVCDLQRNFGLQIDSGVCLIELWDRVFQNALVRMSVLLICIAESSTVDVQIMQPSGMFHSRFWTLINFTFLIFTHDHFCINKVSVIKSIGLTLFCFMQY